MGVIDITGNKYGRLTVLGYAGKTDKNRSLWKCLCECGNFVIARSDFLKSGNKQSCGCLNNEKRSQRCIDRNMKHGMAHTRLYRVWCDMRRRCNNPKASEYKNYGARGIRVCEQWDNDFQTFYDWAMKNGYNEAAKRGECTIDRINVNGDYCPDNCRFVDSMVQGKNKRNNKLITHNGETKTQSEWARYYGKNRSFFCGDDEKIEKRMNGCDEFMGKYGNVPVYAHCVKISKKYAVGE